MYLYVKYAASSCVRCRNCVEICPSYIATGDFKNSPMGRLELVRRSAAVEELYDSFSKCTLCKRCSYFCPLGLDVAEVTRQMRSWLTEMGRPVPYVEKIVSNFIKWGNNVGMSPHVAKITLKTVLKRIEYEKGRRPDVLVYHDGRYLDVLDEVERKPGVNTALLFPSSSDIFEYNEALRGYVYVLNRLGMQVVISLHLPDTANYGYFLSQRHMYTIVDMYLRQIEEIRPRAVVFGECGHGWHIFSRFVAPKHPALHIHQLVYKNLDNLKLKRVEVKKPVVYMDPCNYSRGSTPLIHEPRLILKRVVGDFVELWKNPRESLCCLGGGGLIAPEMLKTAVEFWSRAYGRDFGTAVRPCATCKAQLKRVFRELKIDAEVLGVVELLYRALD
ncbi:MAG: (Fe-S)-binding protein [Pyrobaculum sp.]